MTVWETDLTPTQFRNRFARAAVEEWAAYGRTAASGKEKLIGHTTDRRFSLRLGGSWGRNPFSATIAGRLERTKQGCRLSWHVRRSRGTTICLSIAALLLIAQTAFFLYGAHLTGRSQLWVAAAIFGAGTVAAGVGLFFFLPRTRQRLSDALAGIVGEQHRLS